MVSTGYFMVDLPINENQIESFSFTDMVYLPIESVTVPFPDELITATASNGRRAEISKTVPLIVMVWAFRGEINSQEPQKIRQQKITFFLKRAVWM
jgi:hypothetical protein